MQPHEYYQENGYIVYRNCIPQDLIDRLLARYVQEIIPSQYPFFRQNTNRYEVNLINEFGYVQQSFLDIHGYGQYPEFSDLAKDIYCSPEILDALKEVTGVNSFNLMQTMLFDANTETQPHQDWWYLDTVPNGHLIAAWIALEDIHEKAGRFYILPKSNQTPDFHSDEPNLSHSEWIKKIKKYVESQSNEINAPDLQKGDVLFWNSKTIHGALPTIDPRYSRKSLTAHYLPEGYKFGNLFKVKDYITYKTYKGVNFYRNQPDYSWRNQLKFWFKNKVYDSPWSLKILRKIQEKFY